MNDMTKYILIALLTIVAIAILVMVLNILKGVVTKMPRHIVMIAAIVLLIIIVVLILRLSKSTIGGAVQDDIPITEIDVGAIESETVYKNCIVVSFDNITIEGIEASISEVEKFVDYNTDNNVEMIIVDEYSSAEVFHSVIGICDRKGAKYIIKDEKWLEK